MVDPWWHPHLAFDPCCPPVLVTRRHTCSFVVYVEHNDKNNTTALVLNVNGCPPESKWQMVVSDPGLGSYTTRDLAPASGDALRLGEFQPGPNSDWLLWVTNE